MVTLHLKDGTSFNVHEDDSSYEYLSLMQKPQLVLKFSLPEYKDFSVGTWCTVSERTYFLRTPANIKKNGTRDIEYTLTMGTEQDRLGMYKMRNTVDNRLKWSLTAQPKEFIRYIVDNLNNRMGGNQWVVGDCIEATEKTVEFNHAYLDAALQDVATAFGTEWEITDTRAEGGTKYVISLHKVEYNKEDALRLEYGKGGGFVPGVGRTTREDEQPIRRLYVQGGERNINPATYGSKTLLLPKSQRQGYEGRIYESDKDGYYVERCDEEGRASDAVMDDSLDCSEIYPSRVGEVTEVRTEEGKDNEGNKVTFYYIRDTTIPDTLDYSKYVIPGETATVVFQTGMLAGKEFSIMTDDNGKLTGYDHNTKWFKLVSQEIDGVTMPCEGYEPKIGDKYAVFGINLPGEYIRKAEQDMFKEAVRKLHEYEEQKFTFTGTLQGLWYKNHEKEIADKLVVGGYVDFTDDQFVPDGVLIRITGIKRYLYSPHTPEIELSNETQRETLSSKLRAIGQGEVRMDTSASESLSYVRRMLKYFMTTSREELKNKLSRVDDDKAKGLITFLKGLNVGEGTLGGNPASIDDKGVARLKEMFVNDGVQSSEFTTGSLGGGMGNGFCLKMDGDDSYLEVDRMLVRKIATFVQLLIQEIKHVGGQVVLTPASMTCSRVEEFDDFYRCYFNDTDGERKVENLFREGDLARAQTFNVKEGLSENVSNTYYWRFVEKTADNYIDLSKTDCDEGSGKPSAGDEIVQLGNKTDKSRQTAIILSAYGNDAPYIKLYKGIDSYSGGKGLDGMGEKEFVSISRSQVKIVADILNFSSTGKSVMEYVDNGITAAKEELAGDVKKAQTAAENAQTAADEAKDEATESKKKLLQIESDDWISPPEKNALNQQWADIENEYTEIIAEAGRYGVETDTFDNAYEDACAALSYHIGVSPSVKWEEYIRVDKNTYSDIAYYYNARQSILNAISQAAQDKLNKIAEDASRSGHYLLDLDNDSGQVACDWEGNVTAGYPKTRARVYYGTELDTGWTFSVLCEGCTAKVNAETGEVNVTNVSNDDASVTVTASKEGKPDLSAVFTIVKVKSGTNGVGIKSVTNKYAVSASNTNAPTSWSDTVPTMTTTNRYLWNYEIVTYTDETTSETKKRVIGVYGATGSAGVGIKSITEYYLASAASDGVTTSTQGWTTSVQSASSSKKYLWNYEVVAYTNGTNYTSSPVIIGTYGDKGDKGADSVIYSIDTDVKTVTKSLKGVLTPKTVTCTKYKQVGSGARTATTEKTLKWQRVGTDTAETTVDATKSSVTVTPVESTTMIRFKLYEGSKQIANEDIPVIGDVVEVYKEVNKGITETKDSILAQVATTYSTKDEVSGVDNRLSQKISSLELTEKSISAKVGEIWPENMFPDGNFEHGLKILDVRSYSGVDYNIVSQEHNFGDKCLKLVTKASQISAAYLGWGQIEATPGKTYTVVLWIKSDTTFTGYGDIYFQNGNGDRCEVNRLDFTTSWKKVAYKATAKAGDTHIVLRFKTLETETVERTMYLDGIMVFPCDLTATLPDTFVPNGDDRLLATGIDIANRKITVTGDQFEIRNNKGEVTASVDEDGVLKIGSGEFSGYLKTVPQIGINTISANVNRDTLKRGGFFCFPMRNGYSEGTVYLPSSGDYLGTHLYLYSGSGINTGGGTIAYNGGEFVSLNVETSCTYVELVAIPKDGSNSEWDAYQKGETDTPPNINWLVLAPGGISVSIDGNVLHIYRLDLDDATWRHLDGNLGNKSEQWFNNLNTIVDKLSNKSDEWWKRHLTYG